MNQASPNAAGRIDVFFRNHSEKLEDVVYAAQQVRQRIQTIDSFIQRHTSVVCAHCATVCCIDRHAYYTNDDLIYIYALGLRPHEFIFREDTDPCQFLSRAGCTLDRTVRPAGCNWYFCDALFKSMEAASGKAYAEFDESLQELADLWMEMISSFRMTFRRITGYEIG